MSSTGLREEEESGETMCMILENLEKNGIFLDTFIYPDPQIPSGLIDAVEYVW